MFSAFVDHLKARLSDKLPGEEAQYKLAPLQRKTRDQYLSKDLAPNKASVLILFYPVKEKTKFVLILRPSYDGVHSAQVAFPGGKVESNESITDAALREANEEIGVEPENVKVLGTLTSLYIPVSQYLVHPVVGYIASAPHFIPNAYEVDKIIEADLSEFLNLPVEQKKIRVSSGVLVDCPFYNYKDLTIWGATAMIISELLELTKSLELKL